MSDTTRYRVNTPDVIDESVDGEVLIVHLGTGIYYSAQGTGDVVWRMLTAGHNTSETLEKLGELTGVAAQAAAADVAGFVAELKSEGLIIPIEGDGAQTSVENLAPISYAPPALHKYTDMEALLLLDPVHDVDEGGWPLMRADLEPPAIHTETR